MKAVRLLSPLLLVNLGNAQWYTDFTDNTWTSMPSYLYYDAITTGLALSTHYNNFSNCSEDGIVAALLTAETIKTAWVASTYDTPTLVEDLFDLAGAEFADFYYYCSLTFYDVVDVNSEKFSEFVDANDFLSSFVFNLLENSYQISTTATALQGAADNYEVAKFIASLVNLITDFESQEAASNPNANLK